jgi:hypothetical protein
MIIGKLSENIWVWFKIRKKGMFYFPDLKRHESCFNYFPSTLFSVTFSHFNIYLKHTTIWNQTLLKECLNSHQFQHYQQSEQSPLILSELTEHKKKTRTYGVGNPDPGLGHECSFYLPSTKFLFCWHWDRHKVIKGAHDFDNREM